MFGMSRQMIENIPQQNHGTVQVSRNDRFNKHASMYYFHLKNPDGGRMRIRNPNSNTLPINSAPISYQQLYNKLKTNIDHDNELLRETLHYINGCMQYLNEYPHLGIERSQDAELLRVKSLEQYEVLKNKVDALLSGNLEASKDAKAIYKRHREIKDEIKDEYQNAMFGGKNAPVQINTQPVSSFTISNRLGGLYSPMMQQNNLINQQLQLDNQWKEFQMEKNQLEMDRARLDKEKLVVENLKETSARTFHRCQEMMKTVRYQ